MKWLTNISDPSRIDARAFMSAEEWRDQQAWLADKTMGPAMATDTYTVAELVNMGMVGVWQIK